MVGTAYKKSVKPTIAKHFFCNLFGQTQKKPYLCIAFRNKARAFSSAGLEHLPYKQRVGGSNPSTPTDVTGGYQSGQMGQTVNLLAMPSVVRIHHHPLQ